ncbi:hypothetical protein EON65_59170 [archaeon]|nr:MAG: hypothetical protein EON65_59170 [archaeon]
MCNTFIGLQPPLHPPGKLRATPEEVARKAIALDPHLLDQELTSALMEVLPTPEEVAGVASVPSPLALDKASQLVKRCVYDV